MTLGHSSDINNKPHLKTREYNNYFSRDEIAPTTSSHNTHHVTITTTPLTLIVTLLLCEKRCLKVLIQCVRAGKRVSCFVSLLSVKLESFLSLGSSHSQGGSQSSLVPRPAVLRVSRILFGGG